MRSDIVYKGMLTYHTEDEIDDITDSRDMSLRKPGRQRRAGSLVCCSSLGHKELGTT